MKRKMQGRRGNKAGRKARKSDYENLKRAQGNQTGPKSDDGKIISSMNAVSTGMHLRKFHRLPAAKVGKMDICQDCGQEQIDVCVAIKNCELQDYFIAQYSKAYMDKDLSHIEEINILQTSQMDFLFNAKLKYAVDNFEERIIDPETGFERHLIDWSYIYGLVNMYTVLRKNLDEMKMTRKTVDDDIGMLKKLMELQLDRTGEDKTREEVLQKVEALIETSEKVSDMRKSDKTIQEFRKTQVDDSLADSVNLKALPRSPFAKVDVDEAEFDDVD